MPKDIRVREDEIAGELSGFPPCCIKFFIDYWVKDNTFEMQFADKDHWTTMYYRIVSKGPWQYVPCPECIQAWEDKRVPKETAHLDTGETHELAYRIACRESEA